MSAWSGRRVTALVQLVLQVKGTICHLCGLPGADSADHDPPRSVLIKQGVADPDDLAYLFPAHRYPCNNTRKDSPITDELKVKLRRLRERHEQRLVAAAGLSPRLASRRPGFLRSPRLAGRTAPARISPTSPTKNRSAR